MASRIGKALAKRLNVQAALEMQASQKYMAMGLHFRMNNFDAIANWCFEQSEDETRHGVEFYEFIIANGYTPELEGTPPLKLEWKDASEVFEEAWKTEQMVTSKIAELCQIAQEDKDFVSLSFLQPKLQHQAAEEDQIKGLYERAKLCLSSGDFLLQHLESVLPVSGGEEKKK